MLSNQQTMELALLDFIDEEGKLQLIQRWQRITIKAQLLSPAVSEEALWRQVREISILAFFIESIRKRKSTI